jgi:hypothetical protein
LGLWLGLGLGLWLGLGLGLWLGLGLGLGLGLHRQRVHDAEHAGLGRVEHIDGELAVELLPLARMEAYLDRGLPARRQQPW